MPVSASTELTPLQQQRVLQLARLSIRQALAADSSSVLCADEAWLQQPRAVFVTLYRQAELRGCIGSLQARRSLFDDVCQNACAAAFRDPRFPPLQPRELSDLLIEVAVLTPAQALPAVASESELLRQLRADIDGVIVEQAGRRATYLPKVWAHFTEPAAFLCSLRQKAGLPAAFDPVACYSVYQVQAFAEGE